MSQNERANTLSCTGCVAYIDTLGIRTDRLPTNALRRKFRDCCGTFYAGRGEYFAGHPYRITLHQPSQTALDLLSVVSEDRKMVINTVHVACDVFVDSVEEAQRLYDYFDRHFVQRWHKTRCVDYCGTTRYTKERVWGTINVVMYADRPSKITGGPCLHVEWRLSGKGLCADQEVGTVRDLMTFDLAAFCKRNMILEEVDWLLLGRQSYGNSKSKKAGPITDAKGRVFSSDRYAREGERIARSLAFQPEVDRGFTHPSAQRVRDRLSGKAWFRSTALRRISLSEVLGPGAVITSSNSFFLSTPKPTHTPTPDPHPSLSHSDDYTSTHDLLVESRVDFGGNQSISQGVAMDTDSTTFPLVLHPSYFDKGFFNIRVSHDHLVRGDKESVSLLLGDTGEVVQARITRKANQNKTTRVHGGRALSRWFQANFRESETVYVDLSKQGRWILSRSVSGSK